MQGRANKKAKGADKTVEAVMLVVNKNPAAEPTVQGVFHYFKECC